MSKYFPIEQSTSVGLLFACDKVGKSVLVPARAISSSKLGFDLSRGPSSTL